MPAYFEQKLFRVKKGKIFDPGSEYSSSLNTRLSTYLRYAHKEACTFPFNSAFQSHWEFLLAQLSDLFWSAK